MATSEEATSKNLGAKILSASKDAFGSRFADIKVFAKAEAEKLAVTLRMIIEARASESITKTEARILLNQQKLAASGVFTTVEGMTAAAAQAAINAALKVVKDFVNGKLGFALI